MRTLLLFFTAMNLVAQTIAVSGRVLATDGKPIEGAQVRISGPGTPPTQASTNAEGQFSVENMPSGRYQVNITKPGFIPSNSQTTGSTLEVRLSVASVITGRVTDADGNPVAKAQVNAYSYMFTRGARSLNPAGYSVAADAAGVYSFPALSPGRYYLRVEGKTPMVTTYYPSTLDPAAASSIEVDAGGTRSGIDIRQRIEPVFHIQGKAVDESGAPAVNAAITVLAEQPIETLIPATRVPSGADGSFEFKDLLPGRYVIRAIPNGKVIVAGQLMDAKYAGRTSVVISRDNIDDLVFRVNVGYALSGTVKTEDESALPIPPAPARQPPAGVPDTNGLRVMLMDAEQTFTQGNLSASAAPSDGAFRIEQITPGKYYVRVNPLPASAYVKSVRYGGQDVTRSPIDLMYGGGDNLEIVLGTKAGAVNAAVHNSKGETMPRVQVALWPDKPDFGNPTASIRVAVTDENGTARFAGLRPEKYYLSAFAEAEQAFLRSPDFLDKFRTRAVELDISDGASLERTLEPISREDAAAVIRNLP